jgi:hypothetical protein
MYAEIRFKDKRLLEALEYINEKYIDDVFDVLKEPDCSNGGQFKISHLKHWRQYLAAAACILLLALAMPFVGYVANVIGSIAAGTGVDTSSITEDSIYQEETFNTIESTEQEQTVQEPTPDFQYSAVTIKTDKNNAINPVSVHFGYTWYKGEKSVWTEEHGWQYSINMGKYKYEYFPHLTLESVISFTLPENVTVSSFKVYSANWEEIEHSFDNPYELSNLPAGNYIIVGIEKEMIPFDKPHSPIGEYDYKLDESAIVFSLTVSNSIVAVNDLEYWKFISELEEIDYDTMIEVKKAWAKFRPSGLSSYAYDTLFNCEYFSNYGYLGRVNQAVVIATFTLKERKPISMEIVYDCIIDIYVYVDGSIISLQEAYEKELLTYNDMVKFKNRSEKYRRI